MANLFYMPFRPAYDGTGVSVPGAKAYFTLAGTNTPSAPFSDEALTTPRTNPVIADASGKFPITYLNPATSYRVRIYGRLSTVGIDTPLEEYDPYVPGIFADAAALSPVADAAAASAAAAAVSAGSAATDAASAAVDAASADADAATASAAGLSASSSLIAITAALAAAGMVAGMPVFADTRATLAALPTVTPAFLLEGDRYGTFQHYTAAQYNAATGRVLATDIATDTAQGILVATATGAWVRKVGFYIDPGWFGLSAANTRAANSTAIAAMMAVMAARAANSDGTYRGAERIRFGLGLFNLNNTIDLTDATFIVEGADTGFPAGRGSKLTWPAGVTGIRTQRYNTTGASATRAPGIGGDGAIIRNLSLFGAFAAAEAEAHGIHLRTRALVENVFISNFEGDGIYCNASAGGAPEGNANNARITGGRVEGCRNGIFLDGTDANIWDIHGIDVSSNRQWGVFDSSMLGNTFTAIHSGSNGITAANTGVGIGASVVSNSGNRYQVIVGQEAGASTNAPSGTTADNTWWEYLDVGGAGAGIPAWFNGIVCRAGGSAHTDNPNARTQFFGCYAESGQGTAQLVAPTCVWEGILAVGVSRSSTAMAVYGSFGTLTTKNAKFTDSLEAHGATLLVGPQSGAAAANLNVYFDSTNGFSTLLGRKYTTGGALVGTIGSILFGYGSGMYYDAANAGWAHNFRINGNDVCNIDTNGLNFNAAKVVKFNGTTILNGTGVLQAAGVPAFAGGDITSAGGSLVLTLTAATVVAKVAGQAIAPSSVAASADITTTAGKIGYATGAGGQATQTTSKATAVTLNKLCGDITLNNASLAATTTVSFTFNNSQVAADEELRVWVKSGAADPSLYNIVPMGNGAGSRTIYVRNLSAGALGEAIVLGFAVHKRVVA